MHICYTFIWLFNNNNINSVPHLTIKITKDIKYYGIGLTTCYKATVMYQKNIYDVGAFLLVYDIVTSCKLISL